MNISEAEFWAGIKVLEELKMNPAIDIYDEWDEGNEHKVGHDI